MSKRKLRIVIMGILTAIIFAGGIYLAALGDWLNVEKSFAAGMGTTLLTAIVSTFPGEHDEALP